MAAASTVTELPKVLDKVVGEYSTHQQIVLFDESTVATLLPDLLPSDPHAGWQLYPSLPKVYIAGDTSEIVNNTQLERDTHRRKATTYTTRVRRATGEVDTIIIRCGGFQSNEDIGRGASFDIAVLPTANGTGRAISDASDSVTWTRYALPYSVDTTQVSLFDTNALDVKKAIHSRKNYASVVVNDAAGLGEFFIVLGGWWGNTDPNKGGFTTTCDAFHIATRTWYPTVKHAASRINVIENGGDKTVIETKNNFLPNLPAVSPTAAAAIGPIVYALVYEELYALDTTGMSAAIANKTPFTGQWRKLASSLAKSRIAPSLLVWRDTLLLIGGYSSVSTAEQYTPSSNTWRSLSFGAPPAADSEAKDALVADFSAVIVRTSGGRDVIYATSLYHGVGNLNECYSIDISDEYAGAAVSKWSQLSAKYRYDRGWPVVVSPVVLPYQYFSRTSPMAT